MRRSLAQDQCSAADLGNAGPLSFRRNTDPAAQQKIHHYSVERDGRAHMPGWRPLGSKVAFSQTC